MTTRRLRFDLTLFVAAAALAAGACNRGETEVDANVGPRYRAECTVQIEEMASPPIYSATAQGATMDEAEAATWAALCPQANLPPDCGGNLPEGLRRSAWSCTGLSNFEGTGVQLAGPAYTCNISLTDERLHRTGEATAELEGTDEETSQLDDTLCLQAIIQACGNLDIEGDCTSGDSPEFRVVSSSSSRRLIGSSP